MRNAAFSFLVSIILINRANTALGNADVFDAIENNDKSSVFKVEEIVKIDDIVNQDVSEDDDPLEDDILLEEIDLDNVAPKMNPEVLEMDSAQLKIIEIGFGKAFEFKVSVGSNLEFYNSVITLTKCVQDNSPGLVKANKALITITEKDSHKQIFSGWIFSGYKSLGQPVYKNHFFTLNNCFKSE